MQTWYISSIYTCNRFFYSFTIPCIVNPLPHMPILGSCNSAANKDMMSKILTNGDTIFWLSWKHCGKRRNCWLRAISSFPTMFSKCLLWAISSFPTLFSKAVSCWCVKNEYQWSKGLRKLCLIFQERILTYNTRYFGKWKFTVLHDFFRVVSKLLLPWKLTLVVCRSWRRSLCLPDCPLVCQSVAYPITTQCCILTHLRYITIENIVRKGKIACNKQFLLFSQCFPPNMALIFHFKGTLKCRLQFVSIWTSLKFCRLIRS